MLMSESSHVKVERIWWELAWWVFSWPLDYKVKAPQDHRQYQEAKQKWAPEICFATPPYLYRPQDSLCIL